MAGNRGEKYMYVFVHKAHQKAKYIYVFIYRAYQKAK